MLVSPFVTLKYVNSAGREVGFNFYSTFVLEKCEEQSPNLVHSVKQGGTHGHFFTGMSMEERYLRLTGVVRHGLGSERAIQSLQNVFNPTVEGVLYYENLRINERKEIQCRTEELPQVYWDGQRKCLVFKILLVALDPFWRGLPLIQEIAELFRKFRFKLAIPSGGMSFGIHQATLESIFENAGNVESGFTAVLRARSGTVRNPEIRNEITGEKIRFNYTMARDDVIVIANYPLEKRVEINGINGFRHVDAAETSFFSIQVGTNRIGYRADENVANLHVYVRYTPNWTYAEGQV